MGVIVRPTADQTTGILKILRPDNVSVAPRSENSGRYRQFGNKDNKVSGFKFTYCKST